MKRFVSALMVLAVLICIGGCGYEYEKDTGSVSAEADSDSASSTYDDYAYEPNSRLQNDSLSKLSKEQLDAFSEITEYFANVECETDRSLLEQAPKAVSATANGKKITVEYVAVTSVKGDFGFLSNGYFICMDESEYAKNANFSASYYTVINTKGTRMFKHCFEEISDFNDQGVAVAEMPFGYVFINPKGEIFGEAYKEDFNDYNKASEDSWEMKYVTSDGKRRIVEYEKEVEEGLICSGYRLYDENGEVLYDTGTPRSDVYLGFLNDNIMISADGGGKTIFDINGNKGYPGTDNTGVFYEFEILSEDFILFSFYNGKTGNETYGIMDSKGNVIIEPVFGAAYSWEGIAYDRENGYLLGTYGDNLAILKITIE